MASMATCSAAGAFTAVAAPAGRRRRVGFSVYVPGRRVPGGVRCSAGPGVGISGKLAELWVAARSASPAAVIATVAAAAVVFKVGSSLLAPQRPPPPPRRREEPSEVVPPAPEPVEVGEITAEELRQYDGSDSDKPLLMAIKGQIYDVSQSRMFYGPGGPYALFAGRDASRALAKMSFEPHDLTDDISGLGPFELSALQDWEFKFSSKYVKVGTITKTTLVEQADDSTSPAIQKAATVAEENSQSEKGVESASKGVEN